MAAKGKRKIQPSSAVLTPGCVEATPVWTECTLGM